MKPMLASDVIESKLRFPLIAQPKIDGVRALNMLGTFTGRSLKKFKNLYLTAKFSVSACVGFDGELAAWEETHPDLCRLTSSATGTIKGEPFVLWWLFDYVTVDTRDLPYIQRLERLTDEVARLVAEGHPVAPHLRVIPWVVVHSLDELNAHDAKWLEMGFEGSITRNINDPHKQGRSTPTEGGLGRIKRFVDFEFIIDELIEGEENQNEAQINELGQTFRSSHQANKVANGMVGAMLGRTTSVVTDTAGKVLFEQGQQVRVGAGCMSHDERRDYFANPDKILGHIGKAKFFPKGIKDKPRFPTFQSVRQPEDMS